MELASKYNPEEVEGKWYQYGMDNCVGDWVGEAIVSAVVSVIVSAIVSARRLCL